MNGCVPAAPQRQRVERRQSPVLAGAAQRIGRRADRHPRHDELLIAPRDGSVGVHPDGEVAVEAERQPGGPARRRRRAELHIRLPLQKLKELDALAFFFGESGDRSGIRVPQRRRPVVPREPPLLAQLRLLQRLEHGERRELLPARLLKPAERGALCGLGPAARAEIVLAEPPVQRFEHRPLQRRHGGVVDQPGRAHRGQRGRRRQRPDRRVFGKPRHRGHVDIEVVDHAPARRRIGARVPRLGRRTAHASG